MQAAKETQTIFKLPLYDFILRFSARLTIDLHGVQWASLVFRESNFLVTRLLFSSVVVAVEMFTLLLNRAMVTYNCY